MKNQSENGQDYRSKAPDANGRYTYSSDENAVWRLLFDRQIANLQNKAAPVYLDAVTILGLARDQVPQVVDINARLLQLSGAGVEGVPAIIAPTLFFELLSERKFPIATFLRSRKDIDYIEEPDIFHEVFGHCPLLSDPNYCTFIERFGNTAKALGKAYSWRMFRLFWFTVEFGMIHTPEGLRAFGAGIVSSPSEVDHAFSGNAQVVPFDLMTVLRTPYRIDILQPVYFAIDDFSQLAGCLDGEIGAMIDRAKLLGDLPAMFESAA